MKIVFRLSTARSDDVEDGRRAVAVGLDERPRRLVADVLVDGRREPHRLGERRPEAAALDDASPTVSKPPSTPASSASSSAVSSPGSGTAPKFRCAFVSVRLTRLPQFASSSSLLRRTNSAHVKSVSCVSGPAATR